MFVIVREVNMSGAERVGLVLNVIDPEQEVYECVEHRE